MSPIEVLAALRAAYPYEHALILSMRHDPFERGHLSGSFPTAAGAVKELMSSPWLREHVKGGDTLVFTFERKVDKHKFERSIGHLKALGYREVSMQEEQPKS